MKLSVPVIKFVTEPNFAISFLVYVKPSTIDARTFTGSRLATGKDKVLLCLIWFSLLFVALCKRDTEERRVRDDFLLHQPPPASPHQWRVSRGDVSYDAASSDKNSWVRTRKNTLHFNC